MEAKEIFYSMTDLSKAVICVDSFENHEIVGRLLSAAQDEYHTFNSIKDMLNILESFFNAMTFPMQSHQYRSFGKSVQPYTQSVPGIKEETQKRVREGITTEIEEGKILTFVLHIKFRQNVTWQGELSLLGTREIYPFVSMLEMVRILDNLLSETGTED